MKTTIYRYSNVDIERTLGMYPRYGLDQINPGSLGFCDPMEVTLPDGYTTQLCVDDTTRLVDPQGRVCDLVANKDHGFWIMPGVSGDYGLYVRVSGPINNGQTLGYEAEADFDSEKSKYLSAQEAADKLGISRARVLQLCQTGQLDAKKIANAWAIDSASVEERLDNPGKPGRPW